MKRLCLWLLEIFLPPDFADALIGDFVERGAVHGGVWLTRETFAAVWHLGGIPRLEDGLMASFSNDLRLAARLLRRAPAFTCVVVLTLGLAIGATAAIFSIVEPVLLKPLPYPSPGRLMMVWDRDQTGDEQLGYLTYRDLAAQSKTLERAAAIADWAPTIAPSASPTAERVHGQRVTWQYFRTLGATPSMGRDFLREDDTPERYRVVILSHSLWQAAFGADASIVGKTIAIDGAPMTVAGVMPASFWNATGPDVQIWRVLGYDNQPWACRTCRHLTMLARVRPTYSLDQAKHELTTIHARLEQQYPTEYPASGAGFVQLQHYITAGYRPALLAIAGAVLLVLLIAAANVVNLNLARAVRREHEFAVRTALGAKASRLVQQLLAEGLLLALLGGMTGVLVAWAGLPLLVSKLPDQLPRLEAIHLDVGALIVSTIIVLALSAAIGLTAGICRTEELATALHGGRRIAGTRHTARRVLVTAELALAVVLLTSAMLLGRSLVRLLAVNPGFDPNNLLTLETNAVGPRYSSDADKVAYHQRVLNVVRTLPGVSSVALTNQLPLSGSWDNYAVLDPDNLPPKPDLAPYAEHYTVTPAYFATMHMPVLRGHTFTDAESRDTANYVTVVSQSLAERLWPGHDPIGKRIRLSGINTKDRYVIGVVGDVKHDGLDAAVTRQIYVPDGQFLQDDQAVVVARTRVPPMSLVPAVRRAVLSIDSSLPITWMVTMDQMIHRATTQRRFALVLFAAFAIAAVLLAIAGIYGVLAGSVAERTREFGVRSALGATPRNIVALVVRQGGAMAAVGIVAGLGVSVIATRFLRALLFGVGSTDPATLAAVALLLAVVSLAACAIPARRAVKVNPATALRAE